MKSAKLKRLKSPALIVFLAAVVLAFVAGAYVTPTWTVDKIPIDVEADVNGDYYATIGGTRRLIESPVPLDQSPLNKESLAALAAAGEVPPATEDFAYELVKDSHGKDMTQHYQLLASRNWGCWSFLPAAIAIALCWITREPLSSLLAGIVVGAILVGKPNFLDAILIPSVGTPAAATILILYLWLLGGLMGIWAKTGASRAFADFMTKHFVRGPRTAKLVAWALGVIFFQGGTISSVLVGTTVRPLADRERVSHEELSLIVDATSSPIAVLLAFNAWPVYVQSFIGVAGVSYLATENDRIGFFFKSIPYSFYAILTVCFTFLLSIDKFPLMPKKLLAARKRALELGQLNAPGAEPLATGELSEVSVSAGYRPHVLDFLLPLFTLLGIAIGTYVKMGSPQVLWAFGAALLLATVIAGIKGMDFREITLSIIEGQKSVVLGSVILLLAITIGNLSQEVGAGQYLVTQLGNLQWYWILPAIVFMIALVIAFSTGTSWATFAVTLPLVMPLAHAIAQSHGLAHPEMFVTICFAACINGGVFGDQCSPISDTTILSAMCTGSDLMDHVTTQIPVAAWAAVLAVLGWTVLVFVSL